MFINYEACFSGSVFRYKYEKLGSSCVDMLG